jgi:hypothetical protein
LVGQDEWVVENAVSPELRASVEAKAAALVGRSVLEVTYWDIHNFGPGPRAWEFSDWHHAVMGVELVTNDGPVAVTWTSTFHPYGLETFNEPIAQHLCLGPEGPEGWRVEHHREWASRSGSPVLRTSFFWETIHVGPSVRTSDGSQVEDARDVAVPVALRLDFDEGPVWMVAGIPLGPGVDDVFLGADEVMVVFTPDKMRRIGFPDSDFVSARA